MSNKFLCNTWLA